MAGPAGQLTDWMTKSVSVCSHFKAAQVPFPKWQNRAPFVQSAEEALQSQFDHVLAHKVLQLTFAVLQVRITQKSHLNQPTEHHFYCVERLLHDLTLTSMLSQISVTYQVKLFYYFLSP